MKRFLVVTLAAALFALPAAADAADLVLSGLQISFGLQSEAPHRHLPAPSVCDHRSDHERRHGDRWAKGQRGKEWNGHRHTRDDQRHAPRTVVVDRYRHRCDEERVVIVRPGTRVIVADGRRW